MAQFANLLALLISVLFAVAPVHVEARTNCTDLVTKQADPTLCPIDAPYCSDIKVGDYGCLSCISDCDCQTNEVCHFKSSPNALEKTAATWGTCLSLKDKLKKPCSHGAQSIGSTNQFKLGDKFCGITGQVTDPANPSALPTNYTVWTGECIESKCRQCNSFLLYDSSGNVKLTSGVASATFLNAQGFPRLECAGLSGSAILGLGPPRYCKEFAKVIGASTKQGVSLMMIAIPVLMALFN